jgi:hypothetical protein
MDIQPLGGNEKMQYVVESWWTGKKKLFDIHNSASVIYKAFGIATGDFHSTCERLKTTIQSGENKRFQVILLERPWYGFAWKEMKRFEQREMMV